MGEDPGWPWSAAARPRGTAPSILTSLRIIYLSLVAGVVLFTLVVGYLVATTEPPEDPPNQMAIVVVAVSVLALVLRSRIVPPLDATDDRSLASSYKSRMIVRMALGEAPVLFALVVFFLTFEWWMLALVVVIGIVGLAPPAPTRAAIEADQQGLMTQGSGLSLLDALTRPTEGRSSGDEDAPAP